MDSINMVQEGGVFRERYSAPPTPRSLRSTAKWHDLQAKRKRKNKRDAERHRSIATELRDKAYTTEG